MTMLCLYYIAVDVIENFLDSKNFKTTILNKYGSCIHKIYRKRPTDPCIDQDPYPSSCKRGK